MEYVYIYIYIYVYIALFYLCQWLDEISSGYGNFSINEKFWAVSEIDAGVQQ